MRQQKELFSNKDLKAMIVSLFLEQLLVMLVGMADTLVVSYVGEAAVSGVSLVNQFNTIFIYLFTALASGGAVIISQYIGRNEMDCAGKASSQLLLFSTVFSAVVITMLCFCKKNKVFYSTSQIVRWDGSFMKRILSVAVPNGIENITVIGQCMGDKDTKAADYYFRKLMKITLLVSAVWNLLIFLLTPLIMKFYSLSPETKTLVLWLVLIHNVFNAVAFTFSGALSNGLRAAGDVKFTMYVSVASTIFGQLTLSYLLGITFHMGVVSGNLKNTLIKCVQTLNFDNLKGRQHFKLSLLDVVILFVISSFEASQI